MARRVKPGDKLNITAAEYNRLLAAADTIARDRLASGAGTRTYVRDAATVRVHNQSSTTVPIGGIVGFNAPLGDPEAGPADLARFVRDATIQSEEPSASLHTGRFGVAIEPIAEDKIGRVVFVGLVAARVNIQEASHQYADVAQSGGSILESKPIGSAQILWRRNPGQQGEQWAVVRLGNVDSIPLVRFQLTESLAEFGTAAATIVSSGATNGPSITVSDWAGNYAESGDKGIAWKAGNKYYVIEIKAIASDSPGAPLSIVRFTLTDNISSSTNTAPATIVSSGSDDGTSITVNDWCLSGGMAGDRGIAWKASGNVYYILELTRPRQFLTARISSTFEFTDACPDGPYDLTGVVGVDREWDNSQAAPKAHNPLKIKVWNDCKVRLQFNAVEDRWEIIAATSDKIVHGIEIYKSPSAAPECKLRELQFDGWQNWGDPNWVTEVIVSGTAPNQALRYKTFCTPAASSGALIVEIRNTCP